MTISSTGIGSGLDVSSIVTQLVAIERQPIQKLQSAASTIQTQISAYGKVQSLLSDVRDKAAALAAPALWAQSTASSSDAGAVTATAGAGAPVGEHTVQVSQLARAQTLYSRAIATVPAVVGAGSMTIQLVQEYGPPPRAKDGSSAVTLDFTDPATTLEQVRDRINASNAGVTASVVRDATGAARLALTSKSTGMQDQMLVTTSGAGYADFAYDGAAGAADGLTQGQAASNAQLTINGVPTTSTSNRVTALDGVTLTLSKETATPVKLTVAEDSEAQKKAINDFMSAYNALNAYIVEQTKYDESTKKGGTLQGDSAAAGLRGQLRGMLLQNNGASAVLPNLRSIGFDVQTDGSIKLIGSKLDAALKQPAELAKLFGSTDEAVAGNNGLGVRFRQLADQLTGTDGLVTSRTEGLQGKLKRNQDRQSEMEARVERTRARLEKQYQMLDSKMSGLGGLSSYVTQQMTLLLKN